MSVETVALLAGSHFPGLALATFDARGVTWSKGYGVGNSAAEWHVTADTAFWLASVTKPITGLAILRAIEQGALSLDTKIAELLAENHRFALASSRANEITIRDLVTHSSPIRDAANYECAYFLGNEAEHVSLANLLVPEADCDETQPVDLGGFLESYLSETGAYYTPDNFADDADEIVYSNVGAALAGYAIELATGNSLADYARDNLFVPLELTHTRFRTSELTLANIATPTYFDAELGAIQDYPFYELATWPDGGLRSSANDLGRLYAALLAGGELDGVRILQTESVETAFTPIRSWEGEGDIAVFWLLVTDDSLAGGPRTIATHSGADPGAFTYVVLDREHGFGTVLLANGDLTDELDPAPFEQLVEAQFRFSEILATDHQ